MRSKSSLGVPFLSLVKASTRASRSRLAKSWAAPCKGTSQATALTTPVGIRQEPPTSLAHLPSA
jgi:hypothetical protein